MSMQTAFRTGANAYQQMHAQGGVESADPHKLIAMLMDGALERLALARGHMERGEVAPKGEALGRVTDILGELRNALDPSVDPEFCGRMDALYDYMIRRLLHANLHNAKESIDEVVELLRPLRDSWQQIPDDARHPARDGA
jgi:flagellar secretion chaperone FliS